MKITTSTPGSFKEPYYYKKAGVWLRRDRSQWIWDERGFFDDALCDCIIMSGRASVALKEKETVEVTGNLLIDRRRWPVALDPPKDKPYRKVWQLTRDPFLGFYFAAWANDMPEWIEKVKPTIWLYRPYFVAWRRYLITGEGKYKRRFERRVLPLIVWGILTEDLRKRVFKSKWHLIKMLHHRVGWNGYSSHLIALMAMCAGSGFIAKINAEATSIKNLFVHLISDMLNPVQGTYEVWKEIIDNYKDVKPFPWSSQDPQFTKLLPEGEPHIGKDILLRVYDIILKGCKD